MIQAIPTRYKGYRFRSRTEARWAVFFDFLGVRYEYEPEGYVLAGVPHLPDFWLPESESFFEIEAREGESLEKCRLLALFTRAPVFLFHGQPSLNDPWTPEGDTGLLVYKEYDLSHNLVDWKSPLDDVLDVPTSWAECNVCGTVKAEGFAQFTCHPESSAAYLDRSQFARAKKLEYSPKARVIPGTSRLRAAVEAARSARFEFGQEGAG